MVKFKKKEYVMDLHVSDTMQQALLLPVEQRLHLVEKLLESLNLPLDKDIEAAWAVEAEKRRDAVLDGTAQTVSLESVVNDLRATYGP